VNESFLDRFLARSVFSSGKSDQPIVEEVDLERIIRSDQDVNPQIVFISIDEMRSVNVFTSNLPISLGDFAFLVNQSNSSTTGCIRRLKDVKRFSLFGLSVHFELFVVIRKNVGMSHYVVFPTKFPYLPGNVSPDQVFSTYLV